MWICWNDAFLSVVADKFHPDRLMVRARRRQDLVNVFGKDAEIVKTVEADYRYRTFVNRAAFQQIVADRLSKIDYTNFKNTVRDDDLHHLYMGFWKLHLNYQQREPKARRTASSD